MAVNKVIYNGNTLIDLTGLSITPNDVADGYTTHNGAGEVITGVASDSGCTVYAKEQKVMLEIPASIASVVGTNLILQEAL